MNQAEKNAELGRLYAEEPFRDARLTEEFRAEMLKRQDQIIELLERLAGVHAPLPPY